MNSHLLRTHPYQNNPYYADTFDYHKPLTWDYNDRILTRLNEINNDFVSGKMTGTPIQWLFSTEIEFRIQDSSMAQAVPTLPPPHLERLRNSARSKLEKKLDSPDANPGDIQAQIDAIKDFDVRDLILFEIHEELGDKIEFRFGKQEHGIGYYDNPGVAEIRLTPMPPEQFLVNYHATLEKIREVAHRYTTITPSINRNHVNFSLNQITNGSPINLIEHSSHDPQMADIVQRSFGGILKAFDDGELTTTPWLGRKAFTDLGISRGNTFRISKNRAEYRCGAGEEDHMADLVLKIIGGGAYGAAHTRTELSKANVKLPKVVSGGIFVDTTESDGQAFSESFYTKRILEGSLLDSDGGFSLPVTYLRMRKSAIEEELFGYPAAGGFLSFFGGDGSLEEDTSLIESLFNRVKISPKGKMSVAALRQWPSIAAELTKKTNTDPKERHIDRAIRHLRNIRQISTYTTIASEGYAQTLEKDNWGTLLRNFYNSPAIRTVYGDALMPALMLTLTKEIFGRALSIGDKTDPQDLSKERVITQITHLLDGVPTEQRRPMLGTINDTIHDVIGWNAQGITSAAKYAEGHGADYWTGVKARRTQIATMYLQPLADAIHDMQATGPERAPPRGPKAPQDARPSG